MFRLVTFCVVCTLFAVQLVLSLIPEPGPKHTSSYKCLRDNDVRNIIILHYPEHYYSMLLVLSLMLLLYRELHSGGRMGMWT